MADEHTQGYEAACVGMVASVLNSIAGIAEEPASAAAAEPSAKGKSSSSSGKATEAPALKRSHASAFMSDSEGDDAPPPKAGKKASYQLSVVAHRHPRCQT